MKNQSCFTLRIDEELHKSLKAIAFDEGRSLNSQIEYIIRQYVKSYEESHGKQRLMKIDEQAKEAREYELDEKTILDRFDE